MARRHTAASSMCLRRNVSHEDGHREPALPRRALDGHRASDVRELRRWVMPITATRSHRPLRACSWAGGLKATSLSYWKWRLKRESEPSKSRRTPKAQRTTLTRARFVEVKK